MDLDQYISLSLQEDVGPGDYSALSCIPADAQSKANLIIKDKGILAGIELAEKIFKTVDASLQINIFKKDGQHVDKSEIAFTVEGSVLSILKTERLVLNCMQRMSGIASTTYLYAEQVKHTKAKILDTRKTLPTLRNLQKYAVTTGGGKNHRLNLSDMILIKDNHIEVAGSITKAVETCVKYNKKHRTKLKIEVETKNLKEVEEAIKTKADIIMLDNFEIDEMKKAVKIINGKCKIEASGGVNLDTVRAIAETGVDYISVGALTHSVKALDISLEITL